MDLLDLVWTFSTDNTEETFGRRLTRLAYEAEPTHPERRLERHVPQIGGDLPPAEPDPIAEMYAATARDLEQSKNDRERQEWEREQQAMRVGPPVQPTRYASDAKRASRLGRVVAADQRLAEQPVGIPEDRWAEASRRRMPPDYERTLAEIAHPDTRNFSTQIPRLVEHLPAEARHEMVQEMLAEIEPRVHQEPNNPRLQQAYHMLHELLRDPLEPPDAEVLMRLLELKHGSDPATFDDVAWDLYTRGVRHMHGSYQATHQMSLDMTAAQIVEAMTNPWTSVYEFAIKYKRKDAKKWTYHKDKSLTDLTPRMKQLAKKDGHPGYDVKVLDKDGKEKKGKKKASPPDPVQPTKGRYEWDGTFVPDEAGSRVAYKIGETYYRTKAAARAAAKADSDVVQGHADLESESIPAEPTPSEIVSEPWRYPYETYAETMRGKGKAIGKEELLKMVHMEQVRRALKDGETVPSEVLAEYPKLAAKYSTRSGSEDGDEDEAEATAVLDRLMAEEGNDSATPNSSEDREAYKADRIADDGRSFDPYADPDDPYAQPQAQPAKSEEHPRDREYDVSQLESGAWVTPYTAGTYSTKRDAITAARAALDDYAPRKPKQPASPRPRDAELIADINAAAEDQRQSGRIRKQATDYTQAEFLAKQGASYGGGERAKQAHYKMVAGALSRGEPVPPEVIADYPDLAEKYGKPAAPKPGDDDFDERDMSDEDLDAWQNEDEGVEPTSVQTDLSPATQEYEAEAAGWVPRLGQMPSAAKKLQEVLDRAFRDQSIGDQEFQTLLIAVLGTGFSPPDNRKAALDAARAEIQGRGGKRMSLEESPAYHLGILLENQAKEWHFAISDTTSSPLVQARKIVEAYTPLHALRGRAWEMAIKYRKSGAKKWTHHKDKSLTDITPRMKKLAEKGGYTYIVEPVGEKRGGGKVSGKKGKVPAEAISKLAAVAKALGVSQDVDESNVVEVLEAMLAKVEGKPSQADKPVKAAAAPAKPTASPEASSQDTGREPKQPAVGGQGGGAAARLIMDLSERAYKSGSGLSQAEIEEIFSRPEVLALTGPQLKELARQIDVAPERLSKPDLLKKMKTVLISRAGMDDRLRL